MGDWYSNIYKSFLVSTIITFLIYFNSSGETALGALLTSYSLLTISILMILIFLFNKVIENQQNSTIWQILYNIFSMAGPFLLMLGIIGFILYLIIIFKDNISSNHVSKGFYTFTNISIILLLLNVGIIYNTINKPKFQESGKISNVTSKILFLIGILTSITSLIIYTILKYFTTDG